MIKASNPSQYPLSQTSSRVKQSSSSKHENDLKEHPTQRLQEEQERPSPHTPYWSFTPPQMSPGPFAHVLPQGPWS